MAQNREQLDKLLQFIKRLIDEPGNEDFANGLREMLGVATPSITSVSNPQLTDIKKYLGLDYQIDSTSSVIDYSFIDDTYIKNQLVSDFREMLRYRFGVRSHKIDFSEYCRYAILQTEQLLNYFYHKRFASIEEAKEYIASVGWAKDKTYESVDSISLAVKLSAFMDNHKERKLREVLDFAREVRNAQSHRGKEKTYKTVIDYRAQLETSGFPLTKEGEIYWNKTKDNNVLNAKYQALNKAEYWNYRFELWYLREPFNDIVDALKGLVQYIKGDLSNNNNK